MTSLFSAPERVPFHERTDVPTPEINPFQAPAFQEAGAPADDLGALEQP